MGRMHQIRQQKLASRSVQADAAADVVAGGASSPSPATTEANLQLIRLTEHRKQLKAVQSVERKVSLKQEFLPEYADWVRGLLDNADDLPKGEPNDVLTTTMVWSIDAGAIPEALATAEVVLARSIPLPAQFDRQAPVLIAEEIAEAAMKAVKSNDAFDRDWLQQTMLLTEDHDMPDEVRAKLFKADAQLANRDATALEEAGGESADGPAGRYRALLEATANSARRAIELDSKAGTVTLAKNAERKLEALEQAASSASN